MTANHTLYAKWQSNAYTIEYYRGKADTAPTSGITILPTKLGESSVPASNQNSFTNNPNFLGTYMLLCLSYSFGLYIDSTKKIRSIIYFLLSNNLFLTAVFK